MNNNFIKNIDEHNNQAPKYAYMLLSESFGEFEEIDDFNNIVNLVMEHVNAMPCGDLRFDYVRGDAFYLVQPMLIEKISYSNINLPSYYKINKFIHSSAWKEYDFQYVEKDSEVIKGILDVFGTEYLTLSHEYSYDKKAGKSGPTGRVKPTNLVIDLLSIINNS